MWLGPLLALAFLPGPVFAWGVFPSKMVIGDLDQEVTLRCQGASPAQPVWWKKEGDGPWDEMGSLMPGNQTLRLAQLDLSSAGNYTCWSGHTLVDWTYLAVRGPDLALLRAEAGVTCEAESYNSTAFGCSWHALRPAAFRLRLRRKKGGAGAVCAFREVAAGRGLARVELDACASACPAAQETPQELEVEGVGAEGLYQRLRRNLFWRDLVRPAAPEGLAAYQEETIGLVRLSWAPPGSWIRPTSYFPLRYHLRLEYFGNLDQGVQGDVFSDRMEETSEPPRPQLLLRRAKIRCRDPVANSPWSPWSGWVSPGPVARRLR